MPHGFLRLLVLFPAIASLFGCGCDQPGHGGLVDIRGVAGHAGMRCGDAEGALALPTLNRGKAVVSS
jgi:hypothetical protein